MTKLNDYVIELTEKGLTEADIGIFFLNVVAYADRRILVSNLRTNQEKHVRQRQKEFILYMRKNFSTFVDGHGTRDEAIDGVMQEGLYNTSISDLLFCLDGRVQPTYGHTIEGLLLKQIKELKTEEQKTQYFSELGGAVVQAARAYASKLKGQDKLFIEYRKLQDRLTPDEQTF